MANNQDLKTAIANVIKTNSNNEITGELLQNALLSIINHFGAGAVFAGVAIPNTIPISLDVNSFYIANENGTYVNFGGYTNTDNKFVVFRNKTGSFEMIFSANIKGEDGINGKDGRSIEDWEAKEYQYSVDPKISFLVLKDGALWENTDNATAEDIPGESSIWVKKIDSVQLNVSGGALAYDSFKMYDTLNFGDINSTGQTADGTYIIPYYIGGSDDYLIQNVNLRASNYNIPTGGISGKIVIFDTTFTGNEITKLVATAVHPITVDNSKIISDLNIRFKGNQVYGLAFDESVYYRNLVFFSENLSAERYPILFNTYDLNVGSESSNVYTRKLNLSPLWTIAIESTGRLLSDAFQENESLGERKVMTLKNIDSVIAIGSSLTAGQVSPRGYGWVERMNDLCDITIMNEGQSGAPRSFNYRSIANDLNFLRANAVPLQSVNSTYLFWTNSANGSTYGQIGMVDLERIKYFTESIGAKMLLGSEELWDTYKYDALYKTFSSIHKVPYCDAMGVVTRCCPQPFAYDGIALNGHRGWRGIAGYQVNRDLLGNLPIKQSMKMYKIRPSVVVSNISQLIYENNDQRVKLFRSINPSSDTLNLGGKVIDFTTADNLNNVSYKLPTSQTIDSNGRNEQAEMLSGASIQFNNYALLEVIVDVIRLNEFSISMNCSIEPTNVYICYHKTSNNSATEVNIEYKSIEFSYNSGLLKINPIDIRNMLIGGKIKVIIYKQGSFNISNLNCTYRGFEKTNSEINYSPRKFGTKIFSDTGFTGSNWILDSGAIVDTFPDGLKEYPSYNDEKKHLTLSTNSSLAKRTILISQLNSSRKIAIRVVAQSYIPMMTTRFTGAEYDSFVERITPLLGTYDYDYSTLRISIDDAYIVDKIVQTGWQELYFEVDISIFNNSNLELKLQRVNPNSGVVANIPILVYDVSIEGI